MNSWIVFIIFSAAFIAVLATAGLHIRERNTECARDAVVLSLLYGVPALVSFILILFRGAATAGTGMLFAVAAYTLCVGMVGRIVWSRREARSM